MLRRGEHVADHLQIPLGAVADAATDEGDRHGQQLDRRFGKMRLGIVRLPDHDQMGQVAALLDKIDRMLIDEIERIEAVGEPPGDTERIRAGKSAASSAGGATGRF